jgi:hypothetical protein
MCIVPASFHMFLGWMIFIVYPNNSSDKHRSRGSTLKITAHHCLTLCNMLIDISVTIKPFVPSN